VTPGASGAATIQQAQARRDVIAVAGDYIAAPASAPKPGSAPPPPTLLVGRADDLCALKAHLIPTGDGRARTQILTAIKGWPGVGKTTVAAALAYDAEIAAAFPDGVLWTSLGPTPNVLSELAAWGRALDIDLTRADSIEQASAALAALLRDAHRLLIIDDVWQAEHAQPFKVGGRHCATLLTTRHADVARALAPAAQDIYPLPVLTETESLDLLRQLAPQVVAQREPPCRELARVLDGLPLALQVAGRLLHAEAESGFGVDELLAELRAGERLLQARAPADRADVAAETTPSVAALLRKSTDCLDEPTRAALARLGAFPPKPATFDLEAAQAVCLADDAKNVVRTLVDRGLLEAAGAGRWQLHAVLTLHARSLLDDEGRYAASLRHAAHYASVLRAANDLYKQGSESITRGLALFDLEWPNIRAGQAWAATHAEKDNAAAQLCSGYPDWPYTLDLRLHPHEKIRWMESALAAARRLKDRMMEGVHLGNLGSAYMNLGDARQAIEFYEQRLVIAREIGDRREGAALGNLGSAYLALGDARHAIEFYEQQLVITREIGDRRGEGAALGNLGLAYAALGDARKAIEYHEQALVIDREIGDRRGEGADLGNLGTAYAALGDARRAIELYEQQLVIVREIGDRRGEGNALGNLGNAYLTLGDARKAIEFYEQALVIGREIGDRRGEGTDLGNLGNAYADLGDACRAIEFYEQALVIGREIGDRRGEGNALGSLGNAYADLGDARQAIEFYEQQLVITREIGDRRGEALGSWNLGLAYEKEGDLARAIALMEVRVDYEREIGHPDAEKHAAEVEELRGRLKG